MFLLIETLDVCLVLSPAHRRIVRDGSIVFMLDCPSVRGCTVRKIVARSGRFYARLPIATDNSQVIW